jgi:hypothetical protein
MKGVEQPVSDEQKEVRKVRLSNLIVRKAV